jgi:hypothetical protein
VQQVTPVKKRSSAYKMQAAPGERNAAASIIDLQEKRTRRSVEHTPFGIYVKHICSLPICFCYGWLARLRRVPSRQSPY